MEEIIYFYPEGHEEHFFPQHPERPERIEAVRTALKKRDLWDVFLKLPPLHLDERILTGIHTKKHLENIENTSQWGGHIDTDTYLTKASWKLALNAAEGGAAVADAVWKREAKRGFALTRPPGHHATATQAMGFCLLNNIAISCEYLLQEMGAQKLAVVDIDLHHGNGTQDIFYNRGDVFFVSTHQYPLYPGTGRLRETGDGDGEMMTANLPLPPYSGDHAFNAAIEEVVIPLLTLKEPEMILVSAGFDAHWRDPLGQLLISAEMYGKMIQSLAAWADANCQGRIALLMEGGYDLEGGSACAFAAVSALLGQPYHDSIGGAPWEETNRWEDVIRQAKDLWQLS